MARVRVYSRDGFWLGQMHDMPHYRETPGRGGEWFVCALDSANIWDHLGAPKVALEREEFEPVRFTVSTKTQEQGWQVEYVLILQDDKQLPALSKLPYFERVRHLEHITGWPHKR